MNVNDLDNIFKATELTDFNFPFNKDSVVRIHMHSSAWSEFMWHAKIEFKQGNTEGSQSFENQDFKILLSSMETFMKELK